MKDGGASSPPHPNAHPRTHYRISIDGGPSFDMAADEDSLLRGALRSGIGLPHECSVGGCGACRFELLEGSVDTMWQEAPGLSEKDRRRGKRLACQSMPTSDCRIRVRCDASYEPAVPPRKMLARLIDKQALSPEMSLFTWEVPCGATFLPGQYALVYLPQVAGARAYSMSNLPGPGQAWQFVVRRVDGGQGSSNLFDHVQVGDTQVIDGPYGHAYLRPGARDVVCIAGGSGIGPMLSVAHGVLAERSTRTVHFLLGLRSQADLGLMGTLEELAHNPRFKATVVLSAPQPSPPWEGATGFVHTQVEHALAPALERFDHYFAGPPIMVEAVMDMLLVRHRVPFEQIHFDRFV